MTKLHGKIVSLVSCMALILVMLVAFVATGASAAVIPAEDANTTSVGTPTGVTDPEWEKVPAKELGAVINEDWSFHKWYGDLTEEDKKDVVTKASYQLMADGTNLYIRLKAEDPFVRQNASYANAWKWTFEGFFFGKLGNLGEFNAFRWTDLSDKGITKVLKDEAWGYYEMLTIPYEKLGVTEANPKVSISVSYNDSLESYVNKQFAPGVGKDDADHPDYYGRNYGLYATWNNTPYDITINHTKPIESSEPESSEPESSEPESSEPESSEPESSEPESSTPESSEPEKPTLDKAMKIGTPTGYDDPIWNQVSAIPLDYFKTSTNVAEGRTDSQIAKDNQVDAVVSYKVMYDDTYIYYLYDVTEANYQEVSTYCPAGRDWSKNGIYHVYPKLGSAEISGHLWNLPSKNIHLEDGHYIAMQKVNREMIGLAADATELQVRVYYNGFYGEDGPLPVTDDGSRNYWLWNSSESKSSGAVTFTLSEEKLTPTPPQPEESDTPTQPEESTPTQENPTDPTDPTKPTEPGNVSTGESSHIVWFGAIAVIALAAALLTVYKKTTQAQS